MKRELKVGALAVAALVLFALAVFVLGGQSNLFAQENRYSVRFAVVGALVSGFSGPSNSSPGLICLSRCRMYVTYSFESSNPIHCRTSFMATANVVPLPENGSRTMS